MFQRGRLGCDGCWHSQRIAGDRSDFAGDADDAVPVRPVRGGFEFVNHVLFRLAEVGGEGLSDSGIVGQDKQALLLLEPDFLGIEGEFLVGTHHAM